MTQPEPLLQVEGLKTHFFLDEGTVRAVDGVDLTVTPGRIVCVVGESGCGKSITARSILGLVEAPGRVVGGHIWWNPALARAGANGSSATKESSRRGRRTGKGVADGGRIDLVALDNHSEQMR